jgi:hypothetical protein
VNIQIKGTIMTKKLLVLALGFALLSPGAALSADNVSVTAGSGTSVATDDVSSVQHQLVKIEYGADGAATMVDTATPLPVIQYNAEKAEDSAHSSGDKGTMGLCVRRASATDLSAGATDGDYEPCQVDATGHMRVTSAAEKAEDSAHTSADLGIMPLAVRVDTPGSSSGTDGDYSPLQVDASGDLRTTVTDVVPGTGATNLGKAEDAAHTTADTVVPMAAVVETTSGGTSATDGDYAIPTLNSDGALRVQVVPHTVGGKSMFRSIDLDETEEEVKGSAGILYGLQIRNATASTTLYVKIYDGTAAGVVVGTDTPVKTYVLSGGETLVVDFGSQGLAFATGIVAAATTALADADTGAPAGNAIIINADYK